MFRSRTNTLKRLLIASLVVALAATAFDLPALAQVNRTTFPKNFDKYVRYATYNRGSSWNDAFATPETLAIAKSGKPLPPGTQLVLRIHIDNKFFSYFVMEKGVDWGRDVLEDKRTGDWHFQEFDANGQVKRSAFAERCESCHSGRAVNDYMYTIDRMRDYLP
ncbi:hypothetical protein DWF00_27350 [Bosea caraganae]|uniref:Cytochrome P460 domain-containing protein n=1 Tax=Bosea caraganae TaxID=2763117 RepID=A0A370L9D2_9HYPH|nr:cytochrome P460 family protein [Bosea caraganae]RDJ22039.1 hypothetical protein DWF00_27350 [Bosea caraganae]RDJ27928.1 hypothetical protein DWE98_04805 [Bosea caraganae]